MASIGDLTHAQVAALATAAVLLPRFGYVISELEAVTVAQAGRLFISHGRAAPISANDWGLIEDAVAIMADAERHSLRVANDCGPASLSAALASLVGERPWPEARA